MRGSGKSSPNESHCADGPTTCSDGRPITGEVSPFPAEGHGIGNLEACGRGKRVQFWKVTELVTPLIEAREGTTVGTDGRAGRRQHVEVTDDVPPLTAWPVERPRQWLFQVNRL